MIRRIFTQNSCYELREEDQLVRRVHGVRKPTERIGEDDVWQTYDAVTVSELGMIIQWGWNEDGSARCTITSPVVREELVD